MSNTFKMLMVANLLNLNTQMDNKEPPKKEAAEAAYKYNEAVELISKQIKKKKAAPTQVERDRMVAIENSILDKMIYMLLALIAVVTIPIALLFYYQGKDYGEILKIGGILLIIAFLFPILLGRNGKKALAKKFNNEYNSLISKYKESFCSQEDCDQEIVSIIENTDVFISEFKKENFADADFHFSENNEPEHVSVTLYFYDGFDENSKPKYLIQEIKFV